MPISPVRAPDALGTLGVPRLIRLIGESPLSVVAIAVALTAAVFVIDLTTPLGVTVWAFYFVPFVLLVLAAPRHLVGYVIAYAALATAGLIFSPESDFTFTLLDGLVTRGIFMISLVLVAGLLNLVNTQRAELVRENEQRRRAEEAVQEYAEELQRSNEDLERFAYVASHDLQEPLRSIVSFSQLLERRYKGKLDSDADEFIAFIVDGGQRMQTLILDLLAYSRVNTTQQALRPTNVEDVIAAMERSLTVALREAGAVVTHDPMPVVLADPLQLEQVFTNLVSNAIKFRRPGVQMRINVGARETDGFWEVSVQDNGIGIEKEFFDRIFVIFQRLHTTEQYPGTGIGLAIVKKIIDRHGGRIRVESTPGEGSTFFFTLPAA